MKLAVVKYIEEHGLEKTTIDFNLICKDYGHKILLKYNQIESDFSKQEVCECRGLILEKNTWEVMSMGFYKFFNAGEPNAADIYWNTAIVYKKYDGSLISLYWDCVLEEWCAGTTGTADGSGEVNQKIGTSFKDLFFDTLDKTSKLDLTNLSKDYCYLFELCTPYNIVIKPHQQSEIFLLAIRNLKDLKEFDIESIKQQSELDMKFAETYPLKDYSSVEKIKETFKNMPFTEEGYVVCDNNFNRIKIKNPAYVAASFLKNSTSAYAIVEIIKTNEIEEYISYFPERKDELYKMVLNYNTLIIKLSYIYNELIMSEYTNDKEFAENNFAICELYDIKFSGLFFNIRKNEEQTVYKQIKEYLNNKLNNKQLWQLIKA